jgi:hypothetical protein
MKNKIKTNKILELASKVILNGNAEILVSYMNNLERKIEKREDCLAQMKELKRQQQFEFYNQLEVELWKTKLSLLRGELDLVRHQSKCHDEKTPKEFDVYYTKTKKDWEKGLNTEFDNTYNNYEEAEERAIKLGKNNYLVEINDIDSPSDFIVVSKNYKLNK